MDIVKTIQKTPSVVATTVVREDNLAWWVECEGDGCANVITKSKVVYTPADFSAVKVAGQGDYIATEYTAPSAARCAACGPFRAITA